MCSDTYPIPILSLFFLYHPHIPYFLIQRIFHFLVILDIMGPDNVNRNNIPMSAIQKLESGMKYKPILHLA